MRVQITGIGTNEYSDKATGQMRGIKTLYFNVLDNIEGVDGLSNSNEKILRESPFYSLPFKVGGVYNIFYKNVARWNKSAQQMINVATLEAILDEHMKPIG